MNQAITFGGWLKQRRTELGITRDDLAERLSISPAMLWKLEVGERRPSSQIAGMVADFFRVPDDERGAFIIFARTGSVGRNTDDGPGEIPALAPWRAAQLRHTNLPVALTPLIGREREEHALLELLMQPRSRLRLITLTGAPGIGKTRLALQVASGLAEHFDDGVFIVELAPIGDPDLVLPTVAQTLGVREVAGQAIEDLLRRYVQGKRMLLVLDNFEQVLDAAPSVTALIEASPWLKVLATSREPLHVRGERRFPVPPLAVPEFTHLENLQVLAASPSIELFVERAQAVRPDFTLTQENARDVASICARLEGLPLAIELAAARADIFSPEAMLARLEHRLNVLTGGPRDLPERQRALRSTIEWSYDLLNEAEQKLFRSLAVFVGGCTVEAVDALYGAEAGLEIDTLQGLESLIDKSLLNLSEGSRQGEHAGREPRFTMLEMVGEYAFERLVDRAEAQVAQDRHAGYFLGLVEEAEPELRGPRQIAWLNRLDMEHDNIRAALRWALANKAGDTALRLVGTLRWFWTQRSHYTEGLRWARAVLAMPDAQAPTAPRAKALWSAGVLAWLQGDYPEARAFLEESVSIWREVGDQRGLGHSLFVLGMAMLQEGRPEVARSLHIESAGALRAAGDKSGLALALGALVISMLALEDVGAVDYGGEYTEQWALLEESVQLAREAGDKWSLALALRNLGWLAMRQGDYTHARPFIEESLALQWEMGTRHEAAASLGDLAQLAQLDGELEAALELYERSLELYRDCADKSGTVSSVVGIASVSLLLGDTQGASEVLTEALETASSLDSPRYALLTVEAVGWLMAGTGQPAQAAVLLSAAQAMYKAYSLARPEAARSEHNRYLESARARLDEGAWQQAWARGETMSIEEALQFAFECLGSNNT